MIQVNAENKKKIYASLGRLHFVWSGVGRGRALKWGWINFGSVSFVCKDVAFSYGIVYPSLNAKVKQTKIIPLWIP